VIGGGSEAVLSDMQVADPKLILMKKTKTVFEIHFSLPDRFHFGAGQNEPRIVFFFDEIIMVCGAVLNGHAVSERKLS
jgi:hypothetical protein